MTCCWRGKTWSRLRWSRSSHIFLRIGFALLALAAGWGLLGVYGAAVISGLARSSVLVVFQLSRRRPAGIPV